jgi:hypothetical protein
MTRMILQCINDTSHRWRNILTDLAKQQLQDHATQLEAVYQVTTRPAEVTKMINDGAAAVAAAGTYVPPIFGVRIWYTDITILLFMVLLLLNTELTVALTTIHESDVTLILLTNYSCLHLNLRIPRIQLISLL